MSSVQLIQEVIQYDSSDVFLFKSYDKIIGQAANLKELVLEMRRLEFQNPASLKYHLTQGHITRWLRSMGEAELASELEGVENISLALRMVEEFLKRTWTINRMRQGRMH